MLEILIVVLLTGAMGLGIVALVSWPTMLLFGYVHTFLPVVPAFGFWQTAALVVLVRLILPGGGTRVETKKRRK